MTRPPIEKPCRLCSGKGYTEEHQPGHTHYETDAGEGCPLYHYKRVSCVCVKVMALETKVRELEAGK